MGLRDLLPGSSSSVTPGQAHDAMPACERVLIDVREADEFRAGHPPGARHVALGSLDASRLSADERYVLVCQSGGRSAIATRRLRAAGVDAVNLRGGMSAWARAGLAVEPGGASKGARRR